MIFSLILLTAISILNFTFSSLFQSGNISRGSTKGLYRVF